MNASGGLTILQTSGGSDIQHDHDSRSQTSSSHREKDGVFSPTFCLSETAEPCWDKIPFECHMRRSWRVALPHSSGTFLTPQGLLTHRQCLGDCTTHLFGGGRQVGKAEPRPVGNEMLFVMTHPCAALGGRGSSFSEWVSLCYFLFTGFSRCLFPPGGQWV